MATEAAAPAGGTALPSVDARAGVRVELLGGFRAAVDGRPVPDSEWRLRRSREVVALLALAHGHRLHRDEVVDLLWPDENPASRANSLHQVLHVARRALDRERPRRFLHLQGDLLALTDGDRVMVDVLELEAQASAARRSATVVEWTRIAEASSLELLPECRYAEWSAARRRDVEALHREALAALAEALHAAGDTRAAATMRERVATVDGGAPTHAAPPSGAPGGVADPEPPREHNLPRSISSFVGRDRQLGELDGLLERNRLLTLSGPGGAGKTRLACELARRALPRLHGGAWFTDLGTVSDASLVLAAVAEALAVRPRPGDTLLGVVRSRLRQGPCLLLLDNCEHLLGACAEYAESLLRDCPELTVLATSREPLRVAGEVVWRTPSLTLPGPVTRASELAGAEAVALLVDRAVAVDPSFTLDESNAAGVSRLCHRLDGLPLAIELAAARLHTLSPAQLVERLDERFRLLSAGSRTALTRQQTLAATLDWSHDLLDEPQRAVFRRLSVFAGGFELEAAEAACAAPPVAREEVASLLAELAEKSLVGVEPRRAGRRYRLLETIRAYGRGRLATAGELEETARRHAEWCAALAEHAEPMLSSRDEARWLDRLEGDHDNLIAALVWALDRDPPLAGRLAAGLGRYWLRRLRLSEGIRWLDAALEGVPEDGLLRARLLVARAAIDIRRWGHSAELAGAVEQSARIASRHGDHLLEGTALLLSGSHQLLFALTDAPAGFRLALEVGRREGLEELTAAAVACLAVAEVYSGEDATAAVHLEEALGRLQVLSRRGAGSVRVPCLISIGEVVGPRFEVGGRTRMILEETVVPYRDLGLEEAAAHVTAMQGVLERMRGEIDGAECRLREAHRRFRRLGDERGVAETLARGGNLALSVGDTATAGRRLRAARRLHHRRGDPRGEGLTLTALGSTALGEGRAEEGRRLLDAAWTLFTRAGDRPGIVNTLVHRGDHALMTGDFDAAEERYSSITGQQRAQAWVQFYLADVAEARGDAGAALGHLLEARRDIGAIFGRRAVAACEARIAAFSA